MGKNKKTLVNLICSIMVLATNVVIGFWLSPYIVEHIGVEANGFVTLANNFVAYANLIVGALNSMTSRNVTLEYVKGNYKKANIYYNSTFWGQLILCAVLLLPAVYCIVRLETLLDVPSDILFDVKILFGFIFFNFFVQTAAPEWECGTYIANRLDRTYIPQMATAVFRCIFIIFMMTIFEPRVWYVGLAATIVAMTMLAVNAHNTHVLTPYLRVDLKNRKELYQKSAVKELVGSGIWNSISSVGNILLSGLDLIICNIFLGATAMGVVSLSKILPNYMQQLSSSIRSAFAPELTINYAQGNMEAVYKDLNRAMKITSVMLIIPIAFIISFGDGFFSLWIPTQDARLLQTLSVLAILGYAFTSGTQILYNVFTTTNHVKENSIAMLISGFASSAITIALVYLTDLGIYAVAGVSTVCNLVRNMVFTVPFTAKYLGLKKTKFFPQVISTVIATGVLVGIGYLWKFVAPSGNWFYFILSCAIYCIVALVLNMLLLLNKDDRRFLFDKIKRKIKK